jgi:glycosyltransferase involved in cell wall biosynthesis
LNEKLVTIVTPSYQSERYIQSTIESVLNQTYPNIEYIIMDGGSTDSTPKIIKRYESQLKHWSSTPDGGQADALRKGFEMASGDLLAWINADDVYYPDAVENAVDQWTKSGSDVVYGNRDLIDADGEWIGERRTTPFPPTVGRLGMIYGGFGIYQPAAFWTRYFYNRVGGVDPSLKFAMDRDLLARFVAAEAEFKFIDSSLIQFRVHRASKTSSIQAVGKLENEQIISRYPAKNSISTVAIHLGCLLWKALYFIRTGRFRYIARRLFNRRLAFVP